MIEKIHQELIYLIKFVFTRSYSAPGARPCLEERQEETVHTIIWLIERLLARSSARLFLPYRSLLVPSPEPDRRLHLTDNEEDNEDESVLSWAPQNSGQPGSVILPCPSPISSRTPPHSKE